MSLYNKIKAEMKERLDPAIFECVSDVIKGNSGWFEYQDSTGSYCFGPQDKYCPLRYFPDEAGLQIEPASCKAQLLRDELFSQPLKLYKKE